MHRTCFNTYVQSNIACPLCRKSIIDPLLFESHYDEQVLLMPMPEEYANKKMTVQCNDCLAKSNVNFHILPGKCSKCRSYNTTRVGDELHEEDIV